MINYDAIERNYTPDECYRKATFDAACKGMRSWPVAKAMNSLCPGDDFRGMNKRDLRHEYVRGALSHIKGRDLRAALQDT